MNEEQILQAIISEYSWESVLYNIVIAEGMDPWDIDIVKLADAFVKYLKKIKEMDFRIPAKVVLTASVFLRMKSEALKLEEDEKGQQKKQEQALLDVSGIPEISVPAKRKPIRRVTLEELVSALEKAFEIKERKEVRRTQEQTTIAIVEDNINERIENLYKNIVDHIEKKRMEQIPFSKIVPEMTPDKIIKTFMPLLHLMQEGKVKARQEDLFKEIYIYLNGDLEEDEDDKEE